MMSIDEPGTSRIESERSYAFSLSGAIESIALPEMAWRVRHAPARLAKAE